MIIAKMKKFLLKHWPLLGVGILLITVVFYLIRAKNEVIREPFLSESRLEEGLKLKNIHYSIMAKIFI